MKKHKIMCPSRWADGETHNHVWTYNEWTQKHVHKQVGRWTNT